MSVDNPNALDTDASSICEVGKDSLVHNSSNPVVLNATEQSPVPAGEGKASLLSFRSSTRREWPVLPERALYGPMGEIVRRIEPHSEADPVAIYLQLIAAFGNLVDRGPHVKGEADKHSANLFVMIVGKTAGGRKGTSLGYVRSIMETWPDWSNNRIVTGLSSGEGLIAAVKDDPDNPGVGEKRLFVVETEFASTLNVMARDGNTLSAILRQAWDGVPLRILNKNSPLQATNTHISIVGHITREELRRRLTSTDMANGFANRFLWACAQRSKFLPEGGNFDRDSIAPFMQQLRDAVKFAENVSELKRDDAARAFWASEYQKLSTPAPGMLGSVTSRAEAQVTRLALILALLDRSTVIKTAHIEAALMIWNYCLSSARYVFGGSLGHSIADELLAELQLSPNGLTRTDIRDKFQRNKGAFQINEALELLRGLGLAACSTSKTGGRPVESWRATALVQAA